MRDYRAKRIPEMVECPSIGARKQVMVSEPRRGLSAPIAINQEPGLLITALSLNSLKKSGT